MKIAVFGDSFAGSIIKEEKSWPGILGEKYSLQNFALGGTNLFWSLDQLIYNHESFDVILFVVTSPGRIEVEPTLAPKSDPMHYRFISGLSDATAKLHRIENYPRKGVNTKYWKTVYQSAVDYYTYFFSYKREKYLHSLLVKEIKNIRPDAIVINSFSTDNIPGICEIFYVENKCWGVEIDTLNKEYMDLRNCHMTNRNNFIFSTEIEKYILSDRKIDFQIDLTKYYRPTNKDKDEYLVPLNLEYYSNLPKPDYE